MTAQDRRRQRRTRAAIHEAQIRALKMKKSKRRGTTDLDANMLTLGFRRIAENGLGLAPEEKFARVVA